MWERVNSNPNLAVPYYLSAAYAYYVLDEPFIPDRDFDKLATFMLIKWDKIEHRHKHLITEDDLMAGTLLNQDFPEITKGATKALLDNPKEKPHDRRRDDPKDVAQ